MVIVVVSIPGCGQPQQLWPSHLLHILLYDHQHTYNKVKKINALSITT